MAEPGWYARPGGAGYWDGAAWTEFRSNPDGVPTWALLTWTGFMVLFAVETFLTWRVLLCSPYGCSRAQTAVLLGCFIAALLAVAALTAWASWRPTSSNRVLAIIIMPIAVLGATALPLLFVNVAG